MPNGLAGDTKSFMALIAFSKSALLRVIVFSIKYPSATKVRAFNLFTSLLINIGYNRHQDKLEIILLHDLPYC